MFGSRLALATVAVWGLSGLVGSSSAQEAVPGGWAPQVEYQSFSSPGFSGGYGNLGFGLSVGMNPVAPSWLGGHPGATSLAGMPRVQVQPQVVNGLLPLSDMIRRQSRKRSRR